jgi:transposase-like protein/predicted RNA-binding Zn-ribbon protein involved in translation (DUF1610 family)
MFEKFKGQNLFTFMEYFPDDDSCKSYLYMHRWKDGFQCPKCGSTEEHHSNISYVKRCKKCKHSVSVTSETIFHKLKFSLRKAFYIVFEMSTTTKGSSSPVLAKKLGIQQKTAWRFSHKVRMAMKSSEMYPFEGDVEVDETLIGGKEDGNQGRGAKSKVPVVVAIEKNKNESGIKRAYAIKIDDTSSEELKKIFEKHISTQASVRTDKWTGYMPLKQTWNINQEKSKGGENFELIHRFIMGLKQWLRGIYHRVSTEHLQSYLNEYTYRFNRSIFKETVFDNLIQRMLIEKPITCQSLKLCVTNLKT